MSTKLKVLHSTHSYITREADPEDKWSSESTAHDVAIIGLELSTKGQHYDLEVGFEPKAGESYYLVYCIYDTGDSFHQEDGLIEFVDLFKTMEAAEKLQKIIEVHYQKYKDEKYTGKVTWNIEYKTEEGKDISRHVPWLGYFEHLQHCSIQEVYLEPRYRKGKRF